MRDKLNSTECSKYLRARLIPSALKIVQCLQGGPQTVGEICQKLFSAAGKRFASSQAASPRRGGPRPQARAICCLFAGAGAA